MILNKVKIILEGGVISQGWLQTEDTVIKKLQRGTYQGDGASINLKGMKVLPGFIDCHTHGGYGVAFENGTIKDFDHYANKVLAEGVTSFCQATVTQDVPTITKILKTYAVWIKNHNHGAQARQIGAHIEGPFISPAKKGAHPLKLLKKPNIEILEQWIKASDNNIKLITFAPELANDDFFNFLKRHRIQGSAGHSDISAKMFSDQGLQHNISHITHLFNGMSGVNQHQPGLAVSALLYDHILCEIISDTHHITPIMLKFIYKVKGPYGLCLITDSMRAKGMPDGEYQLGELTTVVGGGTAKVKGTDMLAGSVATFIDCYRKFKRINDLDDSTMINLSSINVAKKLNIFNRTGSIVVGKYADLVVLNEQDDVVMTIVRGKIGYTNPLYQHLQSTLKR